MSALNVPSRDDIYYELRGSTYRNGGVDLNHLYDMYKYVTGNTTGYSRDFFDGHGRPVVSIVGVSNITEASADVTLSLDFTSGEPTNYDVEYDTDLSFGSYDTEFGGQQSATGNVTVTLIQLQGDTTYYVRGAVYNLWNNNAPNDPADYVRSGSTSFTTQPASLQNLSSFTGTLINSDQFDLSWDDPNGNTVDDYQLRWRERNTTTWQTAGTWSSTTNWGTTNTNRSGVWDTGQGTLSGSEWDVEIRGISSDNTKTTDWARANIAEPI